MDLSLEDFGPNRKRKMTNGATAYPFPPPVGPSDVSAPNSTDELDMGLNDDCMAGLLADTTELETSAGFSDSLESSEMFKAKGAVNNFFSTLDEEVLEGGQVDDSFPSIQEPEREASPFESLSNGPGPSATATMPELFAVPTSAVAQASVKSEEPFCFSPSAFYFGEQPNAGEQAKVDSPSSRDYETSPSLRPSSLDDNSSGIEDSCDTLDFGSVESSVVFDLMSSGPTKVFSPKLTSSTPVPQPIPTMAIPTMASAVPTPVPVPTSVLAVAPSSAPAPTFTTFDRTSNQASNMAPSFWQPKSFMPMPGVIPMSAPMVMPTMPMLAASSTIPSACAMTSACAMSVAMSPAINPTPKVQTGGSLFPSQSACL